MLGPPPRWSLALALWLAACGIDPVPPNLLTTARALGIRVEVVEEGPLSVDLLPIPADRVRAAPLPGDTIELHPLIADSTGVRDLADFDLRWFVCGVGSCLPGLRMAEAIGPCGEVDPRDGACTITTDGVARFTIPEIRATTLSDLVAVYRIGLVAGVPGQRTTDSCVHELLQTSYESFDGCVLAQTDVTLGPLGPLLDEVVARGIDLGELPEEFIEIAAADRQPNFHPEIPQAILTEWDFTVESPLSIPARPGTVSTLPPDETFAVWDAGDGRDRQIFASIGPLFDLQPRIIAEQLYPVIYAMDPEVIDADDLVHTGAPGQRFDLLIVLITSREGIAWQTFSFEVED